MASLDDEVQYFNSVLPWKKWSDEEKSQMKEHWQYFADKLHLLTQAWAYGAQSLIEFTSIKEPHSDLKLLITNMKKGQQRNLTRKTRISSMSDEDFHIFLKGKNCL
jgi:hypothetical protein